MSTYDWIVVGAGITGAALSYELAKKGFQVLLLDPHPLRDSATRYSYGGLAYWSGTSELTRTLCEEGRKRYRLNTGYIEGFKRYGGTQILDRVVQIDRMQNQAVDVTTRGGSYQPEFDEA